MSKIKVSADIILSLLKNIMEDEDVDYKITDTSAPASWRNKTVTEVLNVEYYTFKHRPTDTEVIIRDLLEQGLQADSLYSLKRAFCILSLGGVERVFSKDNDMVTVSASLEYWLQTDKVKLLEDLVEDMTIATTGIRIPVQIGKEHRKAVIVFSSLNASDIQEATEFGEMTVCELTVTIGFYPDVVNKTDYTVEFLITGDDPKWVKLPFSSLSLSFDMTQKPVPRANRPRDVGNINLSKVKSIVLAFDGYKNGFVDQLTKDSLQSDLSETKDTVDNNKTWAMRLTRLEESYLYECVVKNHSITVQDDTGNETHSLTLTTRGLVDGAS